MKKDLEKLFDRIILAIKQEQEKKKARTILYYFIALLAISLSALPFSIKFLIAQINHSGVFYFASVMALAWQEALLAIAESLPVLGIILFLVNFALLLFTVRLFLYKKRLLIKYLYG